MPVLGITGGIATGKSTLTRALLQKIPAAELFDADQCARTLAASNFFRPASEQAFGPEVFDSTGALDRGKLRARVFADDAARKQLEAIFHPEIRARWRERATIARAQGSWLLVDIPLLYETNAEAHFDRVIVVGCSESRQIERMISRRGLDVATAQRMIGAQLDLREKIARSHHAVWNDGGTASLESQAHALATLLLQQFS